MRRFNRPVLKNDFLGVEPLVKKSLIFIGLWSWAGLSILKKTCFEVVMVQTRGAIGE